MDSVIPAAISARPWSRLTKDVEPDPPVLRASIAAFLIGLIGFALPWYSVSYTPPGGSVHVGGTTLSVFQHTYSGFAPEQAGLMIVPLGRFSFGENIISGAQLTGILLTALITLGIATVLSWPALAGVTTPALRVLRYQWAQLPVNLAHAVALLIEAIGCLSFLLLALGVGSLGARVELAQELGDTAAARQIAGYLHVTVGSGFWLVLLSFVMLVALRAKQFFTTVAVIAVGLVVLYLLHADQWIGPFLHSFGF